MQTTWAWKQSITKVSYPIRRDNSLINDETKNFPVEFGNQIIWNPYPINFSKIHAGLELSSRAKLRGSKKYPPPLPFTILSDAFYSTFLICI